MISGNYTVRMKALEHISSGIYKISKMIAAPVSGPKKTLYKDWHEKSRVLKDDDALDKPFFYTPTSGSDYKALWHTYGTTIADFRYLWNKKVS